jgi:GNAT superfamily N-acetyltransferase
MRIQDVQPEDTATLDALMHHVVTTSVRLEKAELIGVLENIRQNLHWAQHNVDSVVHLKCVSGAQIVGVVLVKNFWNLCSLFVDPEVQRQGVGRALLAEAIRRCGDRNDRGHIKVNSAPNAVQFYQTLGFSVVDGEPRRGTSLPMLLHLGA